MTTPVFVREANFSASLNNGSVNIDTTGLGSSGAIVVYLVGGKAGGNMTGASFTSPTLGGSSTGWTELIALTVNAASTSGAMGVWVCLNPSSNASIALALAYSGGSGGAGDRIAATISMYSDVSSSSAFTVDNDGGSTTTDTMTNAAGSNNLTAGAWSHGSNISSVTSGTLRGSINNAHTDYANGCIAAIEGDTAAFSSGSSDSNIGMQVKLLGATGVPSAPSELRSVAENDGASLVWPAPADGGSAITDYLVEKNVNSGGWTTITHSAFTASEFHVTGLTTADSVIFRVSAINANGTGTVSPSSVAITVLGIRSIPHVGTPLLGRYQSFFPPPHSDSFTKRYIRWRRRLVTSSNAGAEGTTWDSAGATVAIDYLWGAAAGQSITAQVATVTLAGVAGTVSAGSVSKTAQIATVTLTGVAGTLVKGGVTITAQTATLTLSAVASSSTPGNATVTAQVASAALTAIAGATAGGPVTLAAQVATLTLTPLAGVVVAGNATITAQIATLTLTAIPRVLSAGAVTVAAQVASVTLTAIAGTATAGAATITAQVATITLSGIPGSPSTVGGGQTVTAQVATITLTPLAGTVTGGAISTTAQIATITLTAVAGTVTASGVSKTAQVATLTLTTVAGTVTGGATTITAQVAPITLTAIPGFPSVFGGPQTVNAQIALLTLLARAGVLTSGSVTVAAQRALLTLVGIAGTFPGALPPLVPPFAAFLDGYQATTGGATRATTQVTQTVTSTVNTTPRSRAVNTTPAGVT